MKVPKCKGARDLLPEDMARFRFIEEIFRNSCLKWGYKEIRTPTLEYLHLFTFAGTLSPSMLSKVYSFLDWDGWSGERVALRPDGTIPAARLYVENLAHDPIARLFYVENVFAFEGSGQEARERWQCGAELIGGTKKGGDAELILLAREVLGKLGIAPVSVHLSHAGLIKDILKGLDLGMEEQAELLSQISEEKVKDKLGKPLSLIFDLKGNSLGFLENLKDILSSSSLEFEPYLDDLTQIAALLDAVGQSYQVDFTSGKGFEYYTGVIFQFESSGEILGGGGRYDELIPLIGGGNVPASGFALYMDKLLDLLRRGKIRAEEKILIRGETSEPQELKVCFEVAALLRGKGYIAEIDLCPPGATDSRWIISLRRKGEEIAFDLEDQISKERFSEISLTEVSERLEEAKCR